VRKSRVGFWRLARSSAVSHSTDPHEKSVSAEFREALKAHLSGGYEPSITDAPLDVWYGRVRETIAAEHGDAPVLTKTYQRTPNAWGRMLARALPALGLVLGAAGLLMTYSRTTPEPTVGRVYTTRAGQREVITLSDGSRVTLAPQTSLTIPSDFGRKTRTLMLDGEAFFHITNSAGTPFIVRAGDVDTRVLGTTFSVRRYGAMTTRVVVTEGRVAVGTVTESRREVDGRRPSVVLTAGMVGEITDSSATVVSMKDLEPYTAWVDGRIVLRRVPVLQALDALGRWYGYTFRVADSTQLTGYITNTFEINAPEEMFTVLKTVLDVTMTFEGNVVTLRSRRSVTGSEPMRRHRLVSPPQSERGFGR